MTKDDTIVAIATAVGDGGIGIIRMSGPESIVIGNKMFVGVRKKSVISQKSHVVAYGHILDSQGDVIDEVLLLVMREPNSYTREDVVEIHCHGGPMPLKKILEVALKYGARLAEPGEFTKRAFLNGRLDLSQAEAVIDVIRAKTEASLRLAVNHLGGTFSGKVREFRNEILRLIAHLEAAIDFPEEDIEELAANEVMQTVQKLIADLTDLLKTAQTGRILREGLKTAIIGKPNVGKSSLMNMLLGENRAIVTDIPGTTRDIIEEYVNIGGIPLKVIDTAGIRETCDVVERIGVEKARDVIEQADLILVVLDASSVLSVEDIKVLTLLENRKVIVIINKTDLPVLLDMEAVKRLVPDKTVIRISALEGSGFGELEEAIAKIVYSGQVVSSGVNFVNNVRHAQILEACQSYLEEVLKTIRNGMPCDCIVVDLRSAWEKLGEIIGETVGEDIIDQIFSQFCIGK